MAVVYSRPLTTYCLNYSSSPEHLTPNHMWTMKSTILSEGVPSKIGVPYESPTETEVDQRSQGCKSRLCHTHARWDYTKWSHWRMAKLIQEYLGKDGKVRRLKLLISFLNLDEKGKRTSLFTWRGPSIIQWRWWEQTKDSDLSSFSFSLFFLSICLVHLLNSCEKSYCEMLRGIVTAFKSLTV